jgi:hypothetical protein
MTDDRDAADRAAYEATGNPLHVWFALGRYAAAEPLPPWIRRYLLQSARELIRLQLDSSLSPTAAAQRTARALGLVSKGRNRFAESRRDREHSFIATLYTLGPRKGETGEWVKHLAEAWDMKDERSIRKIVAKMRHRWWPNL